MSSLRHRKRNILVAALAALIMASAASAALADGSPPPATTSTPDTSLEGWPPWPPFTIPTPTESKDAKLTINPITLSADGTVTISGTLSGVTYVASHNITIVWLDKSTAFNDCQGDFIVLGTVPVAPDGSWSFTISLAKLEELGIDLSQPGTDYGIQAWTHDVVNLYSLCGAIVIPPATPPVTPPSTPPAQPPSPPVVIPPNPAPTPIPAPTPTPVPPTKTPAPTPSFQCVRTTATAKTGKNSLTVKEMTYVRAANIGTATLHVKARVNWGDNHFSRPGGLTQSHHYAHAGSFPLSVLVTFTLSGSNTLSVRKTCTARVTVSAPPHKSKPPKHVRNTLGVAIGAVVRK